MKNSILRPKILILQLAPYLISITMSKAKYPANMALLTAIKRTLLAKFCTYLPLYTSLIRLNLFVPKFIFRRVFTDEFPVSNMNLADNIMIHIVGTTRLCNSASYMIKSFINYALYIGLVLPLT